MNFDTIIPGVGKGGLTDKYDIKILVCYLLNSINKPITKEQMDFIFQDGSYANYFNYCEAFSELITSGHISDMSDKLILHDIGMETAKKLYTNLPSSLRDNILETTMGLLARIKHESENEVVIKPYDKGYMVHCTIHETDFDLLSFKIYVPDELQAEKIKTKFQENPTKLYQNLIEYLIF